MKTLNLFLLLTVLPLICLSQVDKQSELFQTLKTEDSLLFERGFNLCDLDYLESKISSDLKFYHDQSGIQDRDAFFENTRKYLCSNTEQKPIRKVVSESLVIFLDLLRPLIKYQLLMLVLIITVIFI